MSLNLWFHRRAGRGILLEGRENPLPMGEDNDVARITAALGTPAIRYHSFGNQPVRTEKIPHGPVVPEARDSAFAMLASFPKEAPAAGADSESPPPPGIAAAAPAPQERIAASEIEQPEVENPSSAAALPSPAPALRDMLGAAFASRPAMAQASPLQGLFGLGAAPPAATPPMRPPRLPESLSPLQTLPVFPMQLDQAKASAASPPPPPPFAHDAAPAPLGGAASLLSRLHAAGEGGESQASPALLAQLQAAPPLPAPTPQPAPVPARPAPPSLLAALSQPQSAAGGPAAPERLDLSRLFRPATPAPTAASDDLPEVLRALRLTRHD